MSPDTDEACVHSSHLWIGLVPYCEKGASIGVFKYCTFRVAQDLKKSGLWGKFVAFKYWERLESEKMEIHAPISQTNNEMPASKDVYAANWDIYERWQPCSTWCTTFWCYVRNLIHLMTTCFCLWSVLIQMGKFQEFGVHYCWFGIDFWTYQQGPGIGYTQKNSYHPGLAIGHFKKLHTSLVLGWRLTSGLVWGGYMPGT